MSFLSTLSTRSGAKRGAKSYARCMSARRGHGDDSIYFDEAKQRYIGAVSLGWSADGKRRIRRKVSGRTKTEVRDKLRGLRRELENGLRTDAHYTVRQAIDDWLTYGLAGRSPKTISTRREVVMPLADLIGAVKLRELAAADVRRALDELATTRATRTVQDAHNSLVRAIRYAEARDLVGRNVGTLIRPPKGQEGRPSRALTLAQAEALMKAAENSRLHAYIVLCLMTGCRTEEARALRWDHLDLDGSPEANPPLPPHIAVWRSVRAHGDVKTEKSRRTLQLPLSVVTALKSHKVRQAEERLQAWPLWQDHGLVFASTVGTPLDAHNVRRMFQQVIKDAGIEGSWSPRELRHTFVSIMSEGGVPVEEIARLAGHSNTRTTETIYRRELRPVISSGAMVMDRIFGNAPG
jgi:integrase